MIETLQLTDETSVKRVLDIQKLAYRIEADLISFDGIPALHETPHDIQSSQEIFLGYFVGEILAGVLSYSIEDHLLDIGRLVVHPDYFRRGIGQALVRHVETIKEVKSIVVSTGAANYPARKLYEQLGYRFLKQRILPEGVMIVAYTKSIS